MARAAVKAKQQATAKAQATARARERGRRKHSGGGNPNQQLFFMRLRRRQKWVFALVAVVFGITFVGVGVGSGSGAGLSQLYTGLFGGGGSDVSKAKDEVKNNPTKGYIDLARAYETKGQNALAVSALQSYLVLKRKDANVWGELGGLELSQAQTLATQYQNAQQAAQLADPSQPFQPTGTLATALGGNPVYSNASQQASAQTTQLYTQATTALNGAVTDYTKVTKLQPRNPTGYQQLATAAENSGNYKVAVGAWNNYLKYYPTAPQRAQIRTRIKQLQKAEAQASAAASASSSNATASSSSGSGSGTPSYP
jgi:tetratricopeptide (TPR) repeat protein